MHKDLGQNFLNNPNVAGLMVEKLGDCSEYEVIEIGPGLGALTDILVKKCKKVTAVELDVALAQKLSKKYGAEPNFELIHHNFLDWIKDFETEGKKLKVVGSIPYYITTPIMHSVIYMENLPEVCVFLVQDEVAYKISMQERKTTHVSSFIGAFFEAKYVEKVDKKFFDPMPKIDSAVLKLEKRSVQLISHDGKRRFEGFLNRAYANPRKMLNKAFTKEELDKVGVDGSLRPQDISAPKWVEAFNSLTTK